MRVCDVCGKPATDPDVYMQAMPTDGSNQPIYAVHLDFCDDCRKLIRPTNTAHGIRYVHQIPEPKHDKAMSAEATESVPLFLYARPTAAERLETKSGIPIQDLAKFELPKRVRDWSLTAKIGDAYTLPGELLIRIA